MKNITFLITLWRVVFVVIAGTVSIPQCQAQVPDTGGHNMDWKWTRAPWPHDDKPYAAIRQNVNLLIKQKKLNDALVTSYKARAEQDPFNPVKQFRWAFAAYALEVKQPSGGKRIQGALDALMKQEQPPRYEQPVLTYNFRRLVFLLMARDLPFHQLVPAGRRLLQRNPNDYLVKYYLAKLLSPTDPKETPERLRLIEQLRKANPDDPVLLELKAETSDRYWFIYKKRSQANRAIAAYQEFASHPKTPLKARQFAQEQITQIKRMQAKRELKNPTLAQQ